MVPAEGVPAPTADAADPLGHEADRLSLKKLPSGKYLYVGTQDERFDARIEHDGTVTFMVDSSVQIQLGGICLVALCVARQPGRGPARPTVTTPWASRSQTVAKRLAAGLVAGAASGLSLRSSGSDGRMGMAPEFAHDPYFQNRPPAPILGAIHGRYGYLPKPQAQMSAFLERTFEFRLEMAKQANAERLAKALAELPIRLLDVWSQKSRPAAERRAELLALWAETERPFEELVDLSIQVAGRQEFDRRRARAAKKARARIEAFVRRHLPEGSSDAFTKTELDLFNAGRTGDAKFDPYATAP